MNDKINSLIKDKSKEERKRAMFAQLTAPAIKNHSPDYDKPVASATPAQQFTTQNRLVVVTLDKLKPYEGNPRKTKNPAYEEIKASIKSRGLDHAPNVTQRPGEDFYIIADGGNTRLQALKELFKETQDPKFWSIECVFKPWQGDAEDINSKLNILIGHLAENDIRGELSFIEKALGIRQVKALYEEMYHEYFSHRKLAEKLSENGYPISNQLIARMEQCLTYLYPHIPNVLLSGIGRPHIEKLLTIHRNAQNAWEHHKDNLSEDLKIGFEDVWVETLSPFDEVPEEFVINDVQDALIGKISEAFHYEVSYEELKLEISLEERKLQRIFDKQQELNQRIQASEERVRQRDEQLQAKATEVSISNETKATKSSLPTELPSEADFASTQNTDVRTEGESADADETASADKSLAEIISEHYASLGTNIGVVSGEGCTRIAAENGLEFANTGRQPISQIWKICPNNKHKKEAYAIALDIAEEVGIDDLIEHVVYEPVDYTFKVNPLSTSVEPHVKAIHSLLTALSTDQIETGNVDSVIELNTQWLLGAIDDKGVIFSDLLLVRIFRLIRLVRYIKAQAMQGGHHG